MLDLAPCEVIRFAKVIQEDEADRRSLGTALASLAYHQPKEVARMSRERRERHRRPVDGSDVDVIAAFFRAHGHKVIDEAKP